MIDKHRHEMTTGTRTVLVVNDTLEMGDLIGRALAGSEISVEVTSDIESARARIDQGCCDVLVTGLGTSVAADVKTLRRLRRTHPGVKMIVLTAGEEPEAVLAALRAHAFSYFSRPFAPHKIREMIEQALAETDWRDGIELVSDRPEWVTVRVMCRPLTADRIIRFVDELSVDLSDEDRDSTATAFREILMNALEHGGRFNPDERVEITRIRTTGMVMYLIRDPGEGFSFEELPHAAISHPDDPVRHAVYRDELGMRAGGFGLLISRGVVDALLHNAKGNEALLIKYLK